MWQSAVLAAIVAAVVSLFVATRNNYMQAVTAERSKWIDKLRNNLAEFSGLTQRFSYNSMIASRSTTSPEYVSDLNEIKRLRSLIKLQLNPRGDVDQKLLQLLDKIPLLCESHSATARFHHADELLVVHAQWLLKNEWQKVKRETSIWGWLYAADEEEERSVEYREFCRTTEIDDFIAS